VVFDASKSIKLASSLGTKEFAINPRSRDKLLGAKRAARCLQFVVDKHTHTRTRRGEGERATLRIKSRLVGCETKMSTLF
jgi:hypothetical protein